MAFFKKTLMLSGFAVAAQGAWTPADSVHQLDAVEAALHQFEHAKLTPEEQKAAMGTVHEVEKTVLFLKSDKSLTKAQKGEKVKKAIQDLQAVQSQWQLAAVEGSLKKVLQMKHLTHAQLDSAKKLVADVDAVVEACAAGKLKGPAKAAKVSFAIKELSDFEHNLTSSTMEYRRRALEAEMKEKQAMLKSAEAKLKFAELQKQLIESEGRVKRLAAREAQMGNMKKEQGEDEAQQNMVQKLLGMAKALAFTRKPKVQNATKVVAASAKQVSTNAKPATNPALAAILKDLRAREQNVTALINKMDAAEAKREADWANETSSLAGNSRTDKVVSALHKKMSRSNTKMRAVKLEEQRELKEAIKSIEAGDVVALSRVMSKMKSEFKSMEAKSQGFLY